jgi:hypothetical protein
VRTPNAYLDYEVENVTNTTDTSMHAAGPVRDPKLQLGEHGIIVGGVVACLAKNLRV